jgi:ATP synthase protein I
MTGAIPNCSTDGAERRYAKPESYQVDGEEVEALPRPLTREEAKVLRDKLPPISPWRVVAVQAMVGLAVAAIWWLVSGNGVAAASALFGAAAVVLPHAVMAAGLSRLQSAAQRAGPGAMVMGFMFWEFMKMGLTVAMLLAAGFLVHGLSWPAVLVAMVVCTKMNWLALLMRGRVANKTLGTRH